jgi:hypothetical protein
MKIAHRTGPADLWRASRPFLRTSVALLTVAFASSCGGEAVKAFSWKDGSGKALVFTQSSPKHDMDAGLFSADQGSKRFVLEKSLALKSASSLAFEIEAIEADALPPTDARVVLSLNPSADLSKSQETVSFPLLSSRSRFELPIEQGSRISSIGVRTEGSHPSFRLSSISIGRPFKGIDREASQTRVSSRFRLARAPGYEEYSIERPFAGLSPGLGSSAPATGRPGILLRYGPAPAGAALSIEVRLAGGKKISYNLRTRPRGTKTALDEALVPADTELLILRAPKGIDVPVFYAAELSPEDYSLADLGRVLATEAPSADFSLFHWDLLPSVLVFDFKDYATQDRYLKRLAFFTEKIGYRGVLAKDEVIAGLHGWNAHDYRAEDLAAFFQAAREKSFPLGSEEKDLGRILEEAGIIVEKASPKGAGQAYAAGEGAMISFAREANDALRWTFAVHESTHAIFFVDKEYRDFSRALWSSVDADEKWFWKAYLGWAGYDSGSDYLMGNEFQAYLLQQPVTMVRDYFEKRKTAELLEKHPELEERVSAYMERFGSSFEARAGRLESWLYERYGVKAGRTVFLTRRGR